MGYKTLLFDLDDTLLDFQTTEKRALRLLFEEENIPFTKEIEIEYKKINSQLWRAFELGKVDKETVTDTRFSQLFDYFGKQIDGKQMGDRYRDLLSQGHDLLGNSKEIITQLSTHYELYIVTNGVAKTQYQRITGAQLTPFFKDVFVSEEVGYQKPMICYFDYVFERISDFEREKTLIIGDSLVSDIQGGINAKIDTVWLNRTRQSNTLPIRPTYEINKLDEIFFVLN